MPKTRDQIPERWHRFVAELLTGLSQTQAAINAGYAPKSAGKTASDLMVNPVVKKLVAEGRRKVAAKLDLSAQKVLGDIARLATKAEKAGELANALRGQELLGKHLKLFTDKVELDADLTVRKAAADYTDDELAAIAARGKS